MENCDIDQNGLKIEKNRCNSRNIQNKGIKVYIFEIQEALRNRWNEMTVSKTSASSQEILHNPPSLLFLYKFVWISTLVSCVHQSVSVCFWVNVYVVFTAPVCCKISNEIIKKFQNYSLLFLSLGPCIDQTTISVILYYINISWKMSSRAISLIKKLITTIFFHFLLLLQYFGPNLQKTIVRNDDKRWNDLR